MHIQHHQLLLFVDSQQETKTSDERVQFRLKSSFQHPMSQTTFHIHRDTSVNDHIPAKSELAGYNITQWDSAADF